MVIALQRTNQDQLQVKASLSCIYNLLSCFQHEAKLASLLQYTLEQCT